MIKRPARYRKGEEHCLSYAFKFYIYIYELLEACYNYKIINSTYYYLCSILFQNNTFIHF